MDFSKTDFVSIEIHTCADERSLYGNLRVYLQPALLSGYSILEDSPLDSFVCETRCTSSRGQTNVQSGGEQICTHRQTHYFFFSSFRNNKAVKWAETGEQLTVLTCIQEKYFSSLLHHLWLDAPTVFRILHLFLSRTRVCRCTIFLFRRSGVIVLCNLSKSATYASDPPSHAFKLRLNLYFYAFISSSSTSRL